MRSMASPTPLILWDGRLSMTTTSPGRSSGASTCSGVGEEGRAVYRPVQEHRRGETVKPQPRGEGRGLPMAMRDGGPASVAALRPAMQARHLGRCGRLVDEDQPFGIEVELAFEPEPPAAKDVVTLLLACMRRLPVVPDDLDEVAAPPAEAEDLAVERVALQDLLHLQR